MLFGLLVGQEVSIVLECDNYGVLKMVVLLMDIVLGVMDVVVWEELESGVLVQLVVKGWLLLLFMMGIVWLYGRIVLLVVQVVIVVIVWVVYDINV